MLKHLAQRRPSSSITPCDAVRSSPWLIGPSCSLMRASEPAKHRPLSPHPTRCGPRGPGPPSFSLLTLDAEDKEEEAKGALGLGQKADLAGLGLQLGHFLLCGLADGTHPL